MPLIDKEQIVAISELVDGLRARLARFALDAPQPGRVTAFLFHRFFDEQELPRDAIGVFPHERISLLQLDHFLGMCCAAGFRFVLPSEMGASPQDDSKAIILTVDDGYADNLRLLPLLERHNAKAVVCVSAANIVNGKRFWPDALYIGARRAGMSARPRAALLRKLTTLAYEEARDILTTHFGASIFQPEGFLDRPMTPDELKQLAKSPRIEIGCHGFDHTILASRSREFVDHQLNTSIHVIGELVGYRPTAISYPNGMYSNALLTRCRDLGFRSGFTLERHNNSADCWSGGAALCLGRFKLSGLRNLQAQLMASQIQYSLTRTLYRVRNTIVNLSRLRNISSAYGRHGRNTVAAGD